jgi:pimeloyl-ACP methyl ester carboxylesterase
VQAAWVVVTDRVARNGTPEQAITPKGDFRGQLSLMDQGSVLHAGAEGPGESKTYVLVHGAWHGGWCWRPVADALRANGHRVFTPTLTGLGERKHLFAREITLDTFIEDLTNLFEMEELKNVVLVGHSFGGSPISGVADRMPDRIGHLVYLDAAVFEGGQSPFSVLPPEVVAARRKLAAEQGLGIAIPAPPVTAFGIPEDHPQAGWVRRRLTPHPLGTYESVLRLEHPVGNSRPRTYIHCTNPVYAPLESSREWVRRQQGWAWQEIATAHDAMVTAPSELARMLLDIGAA